MEERINKAKTILFDQTPADRILDTYVERDYIEFVCRAGGDTLTYRVYNGGTLVER